ncbi:MAG: glutamate 5-kinase [Clostridia bacterium]|nr:glutamate 5-kinase [Clostridia bacterium]
MNGIKGCKRIVIKVGTSTLTYQNGALNLRRIEALVRTISDFKNAGHEVIIVSSGAVGAGYAKLGLDTYPDTLAKKQACAAVGQSQLMKIYENFFAEYGHTVAQILMTKDVIDNPHRLELVKNTFHTLISMKCIPIVNENDSVSSEEMQFGGNDTLSAYVGIAADADIIINLSDIDGLYDKDPRKNPDAKLIDRVEDINDEIRSYAGGAGTKRGTGGMIAKIKAASIATNMGIPMMIINGQDPFILYEILDGKHVGTYFAGRKDTK